MACVLCCSQQVRAQRRKRLRLPSQAATPAEPEANSAQKKQEAEGGTEAFRNSPSVVKLGGMLGMKPAVASSVFEWLNFLVLAIAVGVCDGEGAAEAVQRPDRDDSERTLWKRVWRRSRRTCGWPAWKSGLSKLDGDIAAIRAESEREAAAEAERVKQQIADETARILQAADQEIAAASAQAGTESAGVCCGHCGRQGGAADGDFSRG